MGHSRYEQPVSLVAYPEVNVLQVQHPPVFRSSKKLFRLIYEAIYTQLNQMSVVLMGMLMSNFLHIIHQAFRVG